MKYWVADLIHYNSIPEYLTVVPTILEAHDIQNYAKTAELADKSQEIGLKRVREQLLAFVPQAGIGVQEVGETFVFKLERVD